MGIMPLTHFGLFLVALGLVVGCSYLIVLHELGVQSASYVQSCNFLKTNCTYSSYNPNAASNLTYVWLGLAFGLVLLAIFIHNGIKRGFAATLLEPTVN